MLDKLKSGTKRVVFLMFFGVFGVVFVFGESWLLVSKGMAEKSILTGVDKLIIGEELRGEDRDVKVLAVLDDARPLIIRQYLEKYKSPLAPYSDLIFEMSETFGFEYYWIVAIAQQESNLCKKIPENSYNCWGYGIHSKGTLRFDGYEMAIRSFAEYLDREYFKKGLNTAELMMKKYCPNSNGSWAFGVNQFISEMKMGDF